jgi:DNA polymerase-3 subunit gamma/tau
MPTAVIAQKWRPANFDEVIGQSHVVLALKNALAQQHLHPAYLFTGTRGVGKTTIARIFSKGLSCQEGITPSPCGTCDHCIEISKGIFIDLFEIDAASKTKVEYIVEFLKNLQYSPNKGRFIICLIDEVHMLSKHSFNALLKTLEEPPAHVIFLFATTEPNALPATVLSRCLQFHLTHVTNDDIQTHLAHILKIEGVSFEQSALTLIAQVARGSMRDALSVLTQAINYGNRQIKLSDVQTMLHIVDTEVVHSLLHALNTQHANRLMKLADSINHQGVDHLNLLDELMTLLHHIAMSQVDKKYIQDAAIQSFSSQFTLNEVQWLYETILRTKKNFHLHPAPNIGFKAVLLKLLNFRMTPPNNTTVHPSANRRQPNQTHLSTQSEPKTDSDNPATRMHTNNITEYWAAFVPTLKLTGVANMLAQYCQAVSFNDQVLVLTIHQQHQALLQKKYILRIEQAAAEVLNQPIKVKINSTAVPLSDTPHRITEKKLLHQKSEATAHLAKDKHVQTIKKKFDGTLLHDSIDLL